LMRSAWLFYDFPRQCLDSEFYGPELSDELTMWCDMTKGAIAYQLYDNLCFVCDHPVKMNLNDRLELHSETEEAIRFADGYKIYSWSGTIVDRYVIERPELITIKDIEDEENIEVRRAKMERYGLGRYLTDTNATVLQQDEFGTLYQKEGEDQEPILMVKVMNCTAEPDGTYREYFLRVPPDIRTAKAAVAWTFGLSESEYEPSFQS